MQEFKAIFVICKITYVGISDIFAVSGVLVFACVGSIPAAAFPVMDNIKIYGGTNMRYKESDIKTIQDEYGMRSAKPYIYVNSSANRWFILWYVGEPDEVENYTCSRYTSVTQYRI